MRVPRHPHYLVSIILVAGVISTGLFPAAAREFCPGAPSPRLVVSDDRLVTPGDPNNLRAAPSLNAELIGQMEGGHRF